MPETDTAKQDRVFHSIQEVRRRFAPNLCPECGYGESCSSQIAAIERGNSQIGIDEASRHCLRCHHDWLPGKERPQRPRSEKNEKGEKVFHSIQEVRREFFPGICAECGHDCSHPTSRVRIAIDIPKGSRSCARCGHEWVPPEGAHVREPETIVRWAAA